MTKWILILSVLVYPQGKEPHVVEWEVPEIYMLKTKEACRTYAKQFNDVSIVNYKCKEVPIDAQKDKIDASIRF